MINVVNKKNYIGSGEYIGRGSPLGNPFKMMGESEREVVIKRYKQWLWEQINKETEQKKEIMRLARKYKKEGVLVLICYCAPKSCHGSVIKAAIEWIVREGSEKA